jgi:hypothetical protein
MRLGTHHSHSDIEVVKRKPTPILDWNRTAVIQIHGFADLASRTYYDP